MPIIDTSVYVALHIPAEPGYDASWRWLQKMEEDRKPLVAPAIILAEVGAAISRGAGDPEFARQLVHQLAHSHLIQLVPISIDLALQAAQIAAQHRIRGCDALFVALAQSRGDALCTLDGQQLERGRAVVPTYAPE